MKVKRIWTFKRPDKNIVNNLMKELNISKTTAKLLFNRGVYEVEEARRFLEASLSDLYNPFLLKDMEKVVYRINEAIKNKESIWIYGDYDVDGVSSTALLIRYFNSINYTVNYYIPDRMEEGYGVNSEAIKEIVDKGGKLIITVDCGITSVNEVAYGNGLGIDIVITDHHQCQEELPPAYGIINPKQEDCTYPFKQLCGCGIALKLIQAMMPKEDFIKNASFYLDIVALATVADIVPLIDENRIIVKNGIKAMENSANAGIKALVEVCGLTGKKITGGHIGFMLAPRINAAGRIGNAKIGVDLLTSSNYDEALELAKFLDSENRERQNIEMEIFKQAEKQLFEDNQLHNRKFLVLYQEGWHQGVIGIVASRIVEKYYRPTIVLSVEDGVAKGSARSISGYNIFEALSSHKDMFIKFGGHEQAAGLSMEQAMLEEFKERINKQASETLTEEDFIREISFDEHLIYNEINEELMTQLQLLEPHGMGNPGPKFLYRNLEVFSIKGVGTEGKHLKAELSTADGKLNGIGFSLSYFTESIYPGDIVDVIFVPEYNSFNGHTNLQLNIKDIKLVEGKKSPLYEEYFKSLDFTYPMMDKIDFNLMSTHIITEDKKDEAIIDHIYSGSSVVILVNTINKAHRIISLVDVREKNRKMAFSIYFQNSTQTPTEEEVHIIINPNIDKISFRSYNKIILYDQFFLPDQLKNLFSAIDSKNLVIFYEKGDEKYNIDILNRSTPDREKLIAFYNYFKGFETKTTLTHKEVIEGINKQGKIDANYILLKNALKIFKEAGIVEYSFNNDEVEISFNKPKEKFCLEDLQTYRNLQNSLNSINTYYTKLKQLYMRRS
ncbi:single-stranded-DNA-specific exonuclease RecJ [Alkaliphilus pronyensis]|uniref:Single-stranded-DNA-specific exonuclease RecJ n=1 Tax=Alkaliphilus pronyensis TaxID=1482732 RepID=A0A6I0FDF0_9FIRM|nr:single-stranded-DNA-specific exonuclease RecJ [Alkaliphilus pronyensis]KAB3537276.1 single-stranded-DNA-specific exonuclease RecJ [Alkaliphilus pronyensis]